jgi:hypothetical protein
MRQSDGSLQRLFPDYWCFQVRSRLEKVARDVRAHMDLILNWFRAKGETSAARWKA